MKHLKWILIIAFILIAAYLYKMGMLGFLGLVNDPYEELRRNIGPYHPPAEEDGLWGAIHRSYMPVDNDEHVQLFHTADAFLKGYNLAPDGWTFEMSLADEFDTFYDLNGPMLASQVRVGEYI